MATGFDAPHKMLVFDLDKNGTLDVVADAYYTGGVRWWANDGQGNFTGGAGNEIEFQFPDAKYLDAADFDDDSVLDGDEQYPAVVSSTDLDCSASDIAIKVFAGEDVVDNDPLVAIYSVNGIFVADADGNDIDYLQLDTFTPGHPGPPTDRLDVPRAYALRQNYPNPFNPFTEIRFSIPGASAVRLEVYNILGEKITTLVDRRLEAGEYAVSWDSRDSRGLTVASGIYFYRITVDAWVQTRKMVLLQ